MVNQKKDFGRVVVGWPWAFLALLVSLSDRSIASDPTGIDFFEQKVRPVLVDHCYKCHSTQSDKIKGGLTLDTRAAMLKGGDSGPAIVPGDPGKSLLIKAISYKDENLQMPPKEQLSEGQIADLTLWVKMGAPDPRDGAPVAAPKSADVQKHWAFQHVKKPALPEARNKRWSETPIDDFILAELEKRGMTPSPRAERRTLIRRAYFDLTGLPPSYAAVQEFVNDPAPDAYAKVIDQLLASPHYGERWARHWLDVARYADSKGYVFEEERRYPFSYTYRDYVIRSFNEDLPFNQFVVEQIAADLLPEKEDKRPLAALGFLTLGRRFLNNQPDIIDDRIDVVTRGMMGLTVACARCHDHKYDPIPAKDYYSLYGVFASSSEPSDKPLLGVAPDPKLYEEYLAERQKREKELEDFRRVKEAEAIAQLRQKVGDYLLAADDTTKLPDGGRAEGLARERKLDPATVRRWIDYLQKRASQPDPVFGLWKKLAALKSDVFEAESKAILVDLQGEKDGSMNPHVREAFRDAAPKAMKEVAEIYGKLFQEIDNRWKAILERAEKEKLPAPLALTVDQKAGEGPDPVDHAGEELRQIIFAADAPVNVPDGEFRRLFDVPTAQKLRALKRKVDELDAMHAGAPPRAMSLQDNPQPAQSRVFIRGNPNNPGPEVPRQFLEILSPHGRKPFEKGSGRLDLAQAIADAKNPLTARVMVNRVWLHHFGAGLVKTPSDFGVRSDPPSHPELLDYLASWFVEQNWSLKKLHRLIMLSSVYQQSSDDYSRYANQDPANQWLWRMNRRRLEFEPMRDTLLTVAGKLDLKMGGKPEELTKEPFPVRRTIYGYVERQNLPGMFRTFDFASPDTTSPQRFFTTVPQQALFMINSPFVIQQARWTLERSEARGSEDEAAKIRELYRIVLQREPAEDEIQLGIKFLQRQRAFPLNEPPAPVWQYGYGEYDSESKQLKEFFPLPEFTEDKWQGGKKLPDEKLGWVMLNSGGGHPGDRQHCAVRRWIAPRAGVVAIAGTLGHESKSGDGVRGRIVHSRSGELGVWESENKKIETKVERLEVRRGDTLDFIVDGRESIDSDSFSWAPVIRIITSGEAASGGLALEWNAKDDFSGPKEAPRFLNAWEKYAQALLMSNEFIFVD